MDCLSFELALKIVYFSIISVYLAEQQWAEQKGCHHFPPVHLPSGSCHLEQPWVEEAQRAPGRTSQAFGYIFIDFILLSLHQLPVITRPKFALEQEGIAKSTSAAVIWFKACLELMIYSPYTCTLSGQLCWPLVPTVPFFKAHLRCYQNSMVYL